MTINHQTSRCPLSLPQYFMNIFSSYFVVAFFNSNHFIKKYNISITKGFEIQLSNQIKSEFPFLTTHQLFSQEIGVRKFTLAFINEENVTYLLLKSNGSFASKSMGVFYWYYACIVCFLCISCDLLSCGAKHTLCYSVRLPNNSIYIYKK